MPLTKLSKMKKLFFALLATTIVVSGLVFANRKTKNETATTSTTKPVPAAEKNAAMKQWEATPDGIAFKKWEASAAGKKVYAGEAKIMNAIRDYSNMQGVVTSLTLPPGSRLGFGLMVNINGDDYILSFGPEQPGSNEFEQLHNLKVNDSIIIKSQGVSHAPKYAYPIVSGDYVECDSKIIYKRAPRKGGC